MMRPARIAARSGSKGDNPAAMTSTLTKSGQFASFNKYSRAKVVLPAPFGPARIIIRRFLGIVSYYSHDLICILRIIRGKNFAQLSISRILVRLTIKERNER